jgi:hypothetical protein
LVNFRAGQQGAVCTRVLEKHADELTAAAIITAEPGSELRHSKAERAVTAKV